MRRIPLEIKIAFLEVVTVLIVLAAGYFSYRSLTYMADTLHSGLRPDANLLHLKEIRSNLAEAENSVRLFTLTHDEKFLEPYKSQVSSIDNELDLLYLNNNRLQQSMPEIDSVKTLIEEKLAVWNKMIELDRRWPSEGMAGKIVKKLKVAETTKTEPVEVQQPASDGIEQQSPVVEPEPAEKGKANIFKRLFGRKKDKVEPEKVRTVTQQPVPIVPPVPQPVKSFDTIRFETEIKQLEREQQKARASLAARELELIRMSKSLSDRLDGLIRLLESRANLEMVKKTQDADRLALKTYLQIGLFCGSAAILLVSMFFVIVRYVRKNKEIQNALRIARTEAENLAKAKEQFVANVSHELRTPMNAIFGLTEQLAQQELESGVKEKVQVIKKSTDHLQGIINDILDFSKLEAGKLTLLEAPFDPRSVITDAFEMNRFPALRKNLTYELELDASVSGVWLGDAMRLRQVLINLLNNAIKFTSEGEIRLSASAEFKNDHFLLKFQVSDTGIGISPEKQSAIFDDFTQAEATTSANYGGTGLGLSIVKRLVEMQKGTVSISSQPGKGTVFGCVIPYKITKEGLSEENEVAFLALPGFWKTKRMLVADDEEFNRIVFRTILQKWDVAFDEVVDGKQAVKAYNEFGHDLVLMDLRMPVLNGIEATRKILQLKNDINPQTIVVAVSATGSSVEIEQAREAGIQYFLPKPFSEKQLFDLLNEIQQKAGTSVTVQPIEEPSPPVLSDTDKLDLSELARLGNNDAAFMREMIQVFIRSSRESIAEIRMHLEAGNWSAVADFAHKIASPCRHMKADRLLALAKHIQFRADSRTQLETVPEMVSEMNQCLEQFILQLEEYLAQLK